MVRADLNDPALSERERCIRIAESVVTSSRNWLKSGTWTDAERIAWESRIRAASDILIVIRSGGEP